MGIDRKANTRAGAVRHHECQGALTRKRTLLGGGALERGHGAPLEPLAERGDALDGVLIIIQLIVAETVAS